jgi:hypothetical protein
MVMLMLMAVVVAVTMSIPVLVAGDLQPIQEMAVAIRDIAAAGVAHRGLPFKSMARGRPVADQLDPGQNQSLPLDQIGIHAAANRTGQPVGGCLALGAALPTPHSRRRHPSEQYGLLGDRAHARQAEGVLQQQSFHAAQGAHLHLQAGDRNRTVLSNQPAQLVDEVHAQ